MAPSPEADVATVVAVDAADCLDLRRRVLRDGTPSGDPTFPEDDEPTTLHLGVLDDGGRLVGVATFLHRPCPGRPEMAAVQLRGMAVEPAQQGSGVGRILLTAALERLRAEGADVLWAKARDQSLGFYERLGLHVEGDGYVTSDTGLPHHTVVVVL